VSRAGELSAQEETAGWGKLRVQEGEQSMQEGEAMNAGRRAEHAGGGRGVQKARADCAEG
jgi:hypothetical protein